MRRGGRGRRRYWNQNYDNETPVTSRPPGLRGKELGLYYRDRNKQNNLNNYTINFAIPPHVVTQAKEIIRNITNIEEGKVFKNKLKAVFNNSAIFAENQNNSIENDIKKDKTKQSVVLPDYLPFKLEEESPFKYPDAPNAKKTTGESICLTSFTYVTPTIQAKEEVKTEESMSCSSTSSSLKSIKIKEEVKEEEELMSSYATPSTSSFGITQVKKEIETGEEDSMNYSPPHATFSTSSAPDIVKVKTENVDYTSDNDSDFDLLNLRPTNIRYKYSYQDIITGSFEEKLEESLKNHTFIKNDEDAGLNDAFYFEYEEMTNRFQYKEMLTFREKLPAYKMKEELLNIIKNNQVVVISGETGCGKSTQVPQIILDDAMINRTGAYTKILVTQPRRIAATSLADRVSKERGEDIGQSVGYAVRLDTVNARSECSVTFCTTGVLLSDIETNQALIGTSHIILDEVHERDANVDLTMCLLKQIITKRKDLKIILMSATLDSDRLSAYFNGAPLLHIEGLAYPVQDVYLEEIIEMTQYILPDEKPRQKKNHYQKRMQLRDSSDEMSKDILYKADVGPWLDTIRSKIHPQTYRTLLDSRIETLKIDLIYALISYICHQPPGAILVFVPGMAEITKLIKLMEESGRFASQAFKIYPLHSKLATIDQNVIFKRHPPNIRKIIVATNIAETSITIDDVVYVIDSAKVKVKGFKVEKNLSTLTEEWISKANLRQRRGRAGRCQPGICYHLLTSYRAEKLDERPLAELQRSDLLEPVLAMKKLRLGNAALALSKVMDPPNPSTVNWAISHLMQCGALNKKEILTPLGWHLARLPAHPAAGKLLILGALFGCIDRAASVAAVWGFKDPFLLVIGKELEVDAARRAFANGEPSDQVALSEAIIQWEHCTDKRSFAYNNFLSYSTLQLLVEMKEQFCNNLVEMGFLTPGDFRFGRENRNHRNISLFKAIVAAALYPNIASVRWTGLHSLKRPAKPFVRLLEGKVKIHPSSVMSQPLNVRAGLRRLCNNPGHNWLTYWLKQKSANLYLIDVNFVYTLPLMFFGEINISNVENSVEDRIITIGGYKVRCKKEVSRLIFEMRSLLDFVLMNKVIDKSEHAIRHSAFEEGVLNAVIELMTAEDEQADYGDFGDSASDAEAGPSSRK